MAETNPTTVSLMTLSGVDHANSILYLYKKTGMKHLSLLIPDGHLILDTVV